MSTVAKLFVVLNLLLAAAFLGSAATFLGYVESYKDKLSAEGDAHKKDNAQAEIDKADLKKRSEDYVGQLNAANLEKGKAQVDRDRLATAYAQEIEQYNIVNSSLQKAMSTLVVAQTTIKEGRALADQLSANLNVQLGALKSANDAKDAAIKVQHSLELTNEHELADIQDYQTKLAASQTELERTAFKLHAFETRYPGGGDVSAEQPPQNGKVLAADNKANIVVISLGVEDGVKAGFRYTVSRGSHYIATIEITDVEAKKSAGRSLRPLQKGDVNVGDDAFSH